MKPEFLYQFLKSPEGQSQIEKFTRGSTGQTELYKKHITKIEIPLPPKDEQKNLANKLKEVNKDLRKTRSSIERTRDLLEEYRKSILHHAFKGELVDIKSEDRDSENSNKNDSEGSRPKFDGDGQQSLEQITGGNNK